MDFFYELENLGVAMYTYDSWPQNHYLSFAQVLRGRRVPGRQAWPRARHHWRGRQLQNLSSASDASDASDAGP